MRRRAFIARLAALPALALAGRAARGAQPLPAEALEIAGGATVREGRVSLALPRLAETGHLVPVTVSVESPMTTRDHVRAIHLFAPKNPRPHIASFHLGPRAGRAEVETRIRLAGTQNVVALAELSDGTYWSTSAEVAVTVTGCYDGT